jgi:hypothetical protein
MIQTEGRDHQVLVDSGASLSIFKSGMSGAEIVPTNHVARGVTGNLLEIIGSQKVRFILGKKSFECEFVVAPLDVEYSGIFGTDVLRHMVAKVDLRTNEVVVGRSRYLLKGGEVRPGELLTSRSQGSPRTEPMKGRALPDSSQTEVDLHLSQGGTRDNSEREWEVVTFESIILPPWSQALTIGKMRKTRAMEIPDEILPYFSVDNARVIYTKKF